MEMDYDEELQIEMMMIQDMWEQAERYGLRSEVIRSFYQGAKQGMPFIEAVAFALNEWDI